MARFEISGADAVMSGLWDMVEKTPELRDAILEAEADVIEAHIRRSFDGGNLVKTGKLRDSIDRRVVKYKDGKTIRIGPSGEHHRYSPSAMRENVSGKVSNGYVGYIHEYGAPARGIRARKWLSKAVDGGKSEAYAAADKVYYAFMDKHNF